jgi:hypothetical protein
MSGRRVNQETISRSSFDNAHTCFNTSCNRTSLSVIYETRFVQRRERKMDSNDSTMENKCDVCHKNAEGWRNRHICMNVIKKGKLFSVELSTGIVLVKQDTINIKLHT